MGRKFGRNAKGNKNEAGKPGNYWLDPVVKHNDLLFRYYKEQDVIPADEWSVFEETLKKDLPSAFRIRRSLLEREQLETFLKEKYIVPLASDKNVTSVPEQIKFVPFAYQLDASRSAVRSSENLKALHEFLVLETEIGNVSRQEAVSMVPPLLLDVEPHHFVLDCCASPGSKTTQIIELMHEKDMNPTGLLVANDINNSRCYLLVHQTLKRLPTANCVVVNQDAALMPAALDSRGKPLFYDRILCDVICSGDGTFRKNLELWKSWNPQKGLNLHKVQQNIAKRCVELLNVGGIMVYSTCSLNPIEDEAVVAHLLRQFKGSLELVDVSDKLPDLIRSNGVSNWKVFNADMVQYHSFEEASNANDRNIVPSMFPPTPEDVTDMHLNRSFRILPHAQNSGGFFVAVLRKTGEIPVPASATALDIRQPSAPKKRKLIKEDPFVFINDDVDDLKKTLCEHYGLTEDFPYKNLFIRTENVEKKKGIYYVNDNLMDFLVSNKDRFRVVNAGVMIMKRVMKGMPYLGTCVNKRVISLSNDDIARILLGHNGQHFVPIENLEGKEQFAGLPAGTVILKLWLNGMRKDVCAWMGAQTVTAFVSREEKIHLLSLMGHDSEPLRKQALESRKKKADSGRFLQDINKEAQSITASQSEPTE